MNRAMAVVGLGVPFAIVAARYAGLPAELTVLRNPLAGGVLTAPKSLFTAFRVPVMNLDHGLLALVMLAHDGGFRDMRRRRAYQAVFLSLLWAVGLKSNFEALEITGLGGSWMTGGTMLSVAGGVLLALLFARGVPLPWTELRISKSGKVALALLVAIYVGILGATFWVAHNG